MAKDWKHTLNVRLTKLIKYLKGISKNTNDTLARAPKDYERVVVVMHDCGFQQFATASQLKVKLLSSRPFPNEVIDNVNNAGHIDLANEMKTANQHAIASDKKGHDIVEIKDPRGGDISAHEEPLRPIMASDVHELVKNAIFYVHYVYPEISIKTQGAHAYVNFPKVNLRDFRAYAWNMNQCRYLKAC